MPPIAGRGLVSKSAPPLRLPGEHFAAALVFWLLGAIGLVWVAPDIAGAIGFLALALVLAPFFLTQGLAVPRLATAYVLTLVLGALSLFVAGHYYKILPFLIWFHRFGPLVGKQPVPRVVDLYDVRPGNAAVGLLGVGVLGLVLATLLGVPVAARLAAMLFAAAAAVVAAQMLMISRRRPE